MLVQDLWHRWKRFAGPAVAGSVAIAMVAMFAMSAKTLLQPAIEEVRRSADGPAVATPKAGPGAAAAQPVSATVTTEAPKAEAPKRDDPKGESFVREVRIVSRSSGKALDLKGSSDAVGAAVVQSSKSSSKTQRWNLYQVPGKSDLFFIQNAGTKLCLIVPLSSADKNTGVVQWPCNSTANQQWQMATSKSKGAKGGRGMALINRSSGLAIDVPQASNASGTQLIQWSFHGQDNQRFTIE